MDTGVIKAFQPEIDYDEAGFSLHYLFICRAPPGERADLARAALEVAGVVRVNRLVDSDFNVTVEAIATDAPHLASIHDELDACGLVIQRAGLYEESHVQPFDPLGDAATDENATDH